MSSSQTTAKVHEINFTSSPSAISKSKRSQNSRQSSPNGRSPSHIKSSPLRIGSPKKSQKKEEPLRIVRKIELGQLNPI